MTVCRFYIMSTALTAVPNETWTTLVLYVFAAQYIIELCEVFMFYHDQMHDCA